MTTLTDIRDIETRLHSHILEWDDRPLFDELFYLLDDLQNLHGELDKHDVPTTGKDGLDLTLIQRLQCLIKTTHFQTAESRRDFYGNIAPPREPTQSRMF